MYTSIIILSHFLIWLLLVLLVVFVVFIGCFYWLFLLVVFRDPEDAVTIAQGLKPGHVVVFKHSELAARERGGGKRSGGKRSGGKSSAVGYSIGFVVQLPEPFSEFKEVSDYFESSITRARWILCLSPPSLKSTKCSQLIFFFFTIYTFIAFFTFFSPVRSLLPRELLTTCR